MGQFITVTVREGLSASVRIFDLNRSLTGMAIERYPSAAAVKDGDHRPPAVLAKRLFDLGADTVTVYSSSLVVTADDWSSLEAHGDDAGWSSDSLRAIGVEPLPILFEAPG